MGTIDTIQNVARHAAMMSPLRWRIVSLLFSPLIWLDRALGRHSSRQALRALDDRLLKDIGISRADAEREAGRRFWD